MPDKPAQLENVDLTRLRKTCQEYIDHIDRYGSYDPSLEDIENGVFERALDLVFGESVWTWIRTKTEPSK